MVEVEKEDEKDETVGADVVRELPIVVRKRKRDVGCVCQFLTAQPISLACI